MKDDIAIKVEGVRKVFKLPHEKHSSLKGSLINFGKKGYEEQVALKDISFEVKKGEFFGIVGRNGSGKSTLLKLLAGIYTPDRGQIQISGKLTPFIELGVGFNPELSGRDNIYLNGALLGFNRKEMNDLYDEIVKFAELEKFMDQKLKNYSSGMQVRLAFSIAIQANTDILVLDEVLAVGDAAFQHKCLEYFMLLKKKKQTVVLVTHDMSSVRKYCDRAIMIEKGLVVKNGYPELVAQEYQRLFSDELEESETKSLAQRGANVDRWGNGKLITSKAKAEVTRRSIILNVTYSSAAPIDAPVLGFTIFDSMGSNIVEGNTLRSKYKTKALKADDITEVSWSIPNIFNTGTYSVTTACCDETTTEFYDWLNEATRFSVSKTEETASLVNPDIQIDSFKVKG